MVLWVALVVFLVVLEVLEVEEVLKVGEDVLEVVLCTLLDELFI